MDRQDNTPVAGVANGNGRPETKFVYFRHIYKERSENVRESNACGRA